MCQSNACVDNGGSEMHPAELTKEVNCRSLNVIYVIRCRSGKNIYVGQTKEEFHECFDQHRKRKDSTVYQHFTSEGFSSEDMEMILADIDDDKVRQEKEVQWKKKLSRHRSKKKAK